MSNTKPAERRPCGALILALTLGLTAASSYATAQSSGSQASKTMNQEAPAADTLSARQQAILPIAAFGAAGDMAGLRNALNEGLDAGLTISETREILVQLYAYAGFPRSLNALNELIRVLDSRRQRGIQDSPGEEPKRPIPAGEALRLAGAANQTKLVGRPVSGAVQDFSPATAEYLQSHLFGAIFERDNLDWQSRELATVGFISSLPGAEAQLQAHLGYSMNVGLSASQMQQAVSILNDRVGEGNGKRAREALTRALAARQTK
ncbi:hypothetical protein LMG1861_02623 [Achromobacter piechaudii]|uniref:Uncharacterized protein n=2 Tax=Achromobacter piechaudii TaxID=72556 RepID=A0A6S7CW60_9BURK|nr:hypothetical protein LMG1861_02623 [Achromobacter piechaudii]